MPKMTSCEVKTLNRTAPQQTKPLKYSGDRSMTIQVALVGCAHIHTPNFVDRLQARSNLSVSVVWDHDAVRAAETATRLNASKVSDPAAIWSDAAIEAVVVCTETNLHEEVVLQAAAAGKHLFVEKPLGMGQADAQRMADAIDAAGVLFQTGYFMRGWPVHQFVREQIEAGTFGHITRIRHTNCHPGGLDGWFEPRWLWMTDLAQAGVGAFGDLGTHSLDVMMWMLGDVAAVTAHVDVALDRFDGCDEYGEGLLRFENGVLGSIAAGWVDVAHPISLLISGTEGHAYVRNGELYFTSRVVPETDGKIACTDLPEAWPHAFDIFLDAISGKPHAPLVTPQEAATRSAVMAAFYQAAAAQTWVTVASA
jgi:predicted dehydrogenase